MPFIKKLPPIEIDPLVKALTPDQLEKDVGEFERFLDGCVREQEVHDFLADHSYFFNHIIRLNGASPLYSKIKLGSEFEIDFACFDAGSPGPEWHLIEIEGPGSPLFTNAGDPSARLTHAIRQVLDWQGWIHENLDYARKLFPYIEYPLGYVFMGRRHGLTPATRKRLRRLNYEHRSSLKIHSLDWFASAARSVISLIEHTGQGSWALPMRALTHKDLAGGLPPLAQDYIRYFANSPMGARHFHDFIGWREWKYEESGGVDGEDVI